MRPCTTNGRLRSVDSYHGGGPEIEMLGSRDAGFLGLSTQKVCTMSDPNDAAEPMDEGLLDSMQGGAAEPVSREQLIRLRGQDEPHE